MSIETWPELASAYKNLIELNENFLKRQKANLDDWEEFIAVRAAFYVSAELSLSVINHNFQSRNIVLSQEEERMRDKVAEKIKIIFKSEEKLSAIIKNDLKESKQALGKLKKGQIIFKAYGSLAKTPHWPKMIDQVG